jgi:hypothetical protein
LSFKDYKKSRTNDFAEIYKDAEELNKTQQKVTYEADPDDWYPGVDKAGNGISIIRILPAIEGEGKLPLVKWFSHNFQNPANDRWYIENSLTTPRGVEEMDDPLGEYNKRLWDSTKLKDHPNRKQASHQKRVLNYRTNVFIVSDSSNPENNGKVKKWKFGKFFFDMINLAMYPPVIEGSDEQDQKLIPFDMYEGANLKIQIYSELKDGKKQRNYSRSSWKERGPFGDEPLMETVYKELQSDPKWSLRQYLAPDKFKTYEALKKRLDYVMDFDTGLYLTAADAAAAAGKPVTSQTQRTSQKTEEKSDDPDGDEYFTNLLK